MSSIGVWIWLIIVLFGVINSIRKKAARSQAIVRASQPPQQQYRPVQEAQQPAAAPPSPVYTAAAAYVPAAPRAAAVPSAPQPPAPVAVTQPAEVPPVPARVVVPLPPRPAASGVFDGLFEDSRSIVRGIVIAEVLGTPKALSEQPFWSPPPSVR